MACSSHQNESESPVPKDRPENSSKALSKSNSAIPAGAVRELLGRLPWLSTSRSTKTLSERFSPAIIDTNRIPLDPPGSPSLDIWRIAPGVSICSGVNQATLRSWSSWINTRAGSSGSAPMPEWSMVWHSAGCSIRTFEVAERCRSTSAPTTIRFICSSNGKPIYESWR